VVRNKDVYWVRQDVLNNRVSFYVETWETHAEKHRWDKTPASQEHVYQAIIDPDHAHRSLDPVIGNESCIFEKFFEIEQQRFFVPVLYEGVLIPGDYDQGGKTGKVLTGYFPGRLNNSSTIGEIFWSNPKFDETGGSE
jgi:hypothetical protein